MTKTRKRQRATTTDVDHDESKKARGRPRVEETDQSAADRRRTQIRLAQRAYRQRKESTISTLESQVTDLQATVEQMSKAFLAFNDKLINSDMLQNNGELVRELQKTTQHFLSLAKSADSETEDAQSEHVEAKQAEAGPEIMNYRSYIPPFEPQQNPTPPTSDSSPTQVDIGLGYVQILDDSPSSKEPSPEPLDQNIPVGQDVTVGFPNSNFQLTQQSVADFPLFPGANATTIQPGPLFPEAFPYFQTYPIAPQSPKLFNSVSLSPPYTFSTEESTFSRRLYRAAIEGAYHVLSIGDPGPNGYHRAFELSLLYHSRDALVCFAGMILNKSLDKPIEFFHTPFLQLGGAGTHFAKRKKRNAYILKFGPVRKTARLQHVDTGEDAGLELTLDWNKYEGEWLDCDDVEGYLEMLGIIIHPRTNVHEMDMPELGPLAELLKKHNVISTSQSTSPPTWSDASTNVDLSNDPGVLGNGAAQLFPELGLQDFSSTAWPNELFNATWTMDSSDPTSGFFGSGWTVKESPSGWHIADALNVIPDTSAPQPLLNESKKLFLDVDAFIGAILKKSICLGRSPGFRKTDVEKALIESIIKFS